MYKVLKISLAAGFVLAMVFISSCSGSDGSNGGDGGRDDSSSSIYSSSGGDVSSSSGGDNSSSSIYSSSGGDCTTDCSSSSGDGKAIGAVVVAPTLDTKTATSITIVAQATLSNGQTVEYGINGTNAAPSTWQDGLTFSGLTDNTAYYIFARSKENTTYNAGTASASLSVTTTIADPYGLNGTWLQTEGSSAYESKITFSGYTWELGYDELPYAKGTFSISGGEMTLIFTHYYDEDEGDWVEEESIESGSYSKDGNTFTFGSATYTKVSTANPYGLNGTYISDAGNYTKLILNGNNWETQEYDGGWKNMDKGTFVIFGTSFAWVYTHYWNGSKWEEGGGGTFHNFAKTATTLTFTGGYTSWFTAPDGNNDGHWVKQL